ncbi:hypothetical protein H072_237 [Dactylellina haptotyla CBS 200.50]|uniref:Uncharacterized protein n=1 Tax=Dactylellina haptotyla (strain CBS 200.50) TaxID=1284197 RepID=S8AS36_DACHA|nr:hypothetical protein H072_237 [Dactylellina haptotyla CBS 200.50]
MSAPSTATSSRLTDSFWSVVNDTSITDPAINLSEIYKTPTKKPLATVSIDKQVNQILDESLNGLTFRPIENLPSSVSTFQKRVHVKDASIHMTSTSEDSHRSLLSESFSSLSSSAQEMPLHPAYNITTQNDRAILKMHHHNDKLDVLTQILPNSPDVHGAKDFGETMDIDLSEDNKENLDPSTFASSFELQMTDDSIVPGTPQSSTMIDASSFLYTCTPIKDSLNKKKLQMMKEFLPTDQLTISPLENKSFSPVDPNVSFVRPRLDDDIDMDVEVFQNITTDVPMLANKQWGARGPVSSDIYRTPAILESKIGNQHTFTNGLDPYGTKRNVNEVVPPAPASQKMLHKSAKLKEVPMITVTPSPYQREATRKARNRRKLADLKKRFPKNVYESGGKRRKDLLDMIKNGSDSLTLDANDTEWTERDIAGFEENIF